MVIDALSPKSKTFPWKLHEMLQLAEKEGFGGIVSWLPDGTSFKVYEPILFVQEVMPKFFHQSKYKSFQRQLNLWGFERITTGLGKGGYTRSNHFFRYNPSEICKIKRRKIKCTEGSRIKKPNVITPTKDTRANSSHVTQRKRSTSTASVVIVPTKNANQNSNNLTKPMKLSSAASVVSNNYSDVSSVSSESDWSQSSAFEPVTLPTVMYEMDFPSTPLTDILEDEKCPQTGDCLDFEGRSYFFVDEEEIETTTETATSNVPHVQQVPLSPTTLALNPPYSSISFSNPLYCDYSVRDFAPPYVGGSRI